MSDVFTDEDVVKGNEYHQLGPAYFASRRSAERFMASFEASHFKPLVDKFAKEFSDQLWTDISAHLLSDTENNLAGEMYRMVDACVKAILEGEGWALHKYALSKRYDGERVRAAVAKYIPRELQDQLILDLQAEVKLLRERISSLLR